MTKLLFKSQPKRFISNNYQFLYSSFFYTYLHLRHKIHFKRTKHLVALLLHLSSIKSPKVHILGSGSSVLDTITSIEHSDIVIGNNMSCLLDIPHDIYFAEICGSSISHFSDGMLQLIRTNQYKLNHCYFKNLRASYNNPKKAFAEYSELGFDFVADQSLYCQYLDGINDLIGSFFLYDFFLPQFKSSVLSIIYICYLAGLNNIILHGFDFGGPYFFDTPSWFSISPIRVDSFIPRDYFYPVATFNSKHTVSKGAVPLSNILHSLSTSSKYGSLNLTFANR